MPAAPILLTLNLSTITKIASKIAWFWAEMKKNTRFLQNLNFNLFCNDNVCFRIFAWSATLSTSLS